MISNGETTVSLLTPPGRGAIASLAVFGPSAWDVVRGLCRGCRLPSSPQTGSVWYGRIGDDVILAVKTEDPPHMEIHCHGGTEVVTYLTELIAEKGVVVSDWQSFVRRCKDAYFASVQEQLAKAPTLRTASILLDQFHGAYRDAVAEIVGFLRTNRIEEAARALKRVTQYERVGRHLIDPWKVVIAGAPNVGKSSLVNALAGFQRAVVSPMAGTTRDVVSTTTALDGWPVDIFDTAGWRRRAETLEQQGIVKAAAAMGNADLCLWVVDGSVDPQWPDETNERFLFVVNKCDLPAKWDHSQCGEAVRVSAKTGDGVPGLCETIANVLVPNPPPPKAAIPFTRELCDRVQRAETAHRANDVVTAIRELNLLAR